MAPESADSDPKVKDLIDAATQADLERWFGLPSFTQLAEEGKPPPEPEPSEFQKRRDAALAAVDPALVEEHYRRHDLPPEAVLRFRATLKQEDEDPIGLFDHAMLDRFHTIAEGKEYEIPWELTRDLEEATPQALLRDLHRAEIDFQKHLVIDEEQVVQPFEATAAVGEIMATRWSIPKVPPAARELRTILHDLHREYREPVDLTKLPNRNPELT